MNLLIDIGNSSLKYVFVEKGQLTTIERISHCELFPEFFDQYWHRVNQIIFASVANDNLAKEIIEWAKTRNIAIEQVFTPAEKFGITVGYENHHQLGVDRWLTFIAAAQLYPQTNCLIIDLGTATTVDLVRKDGQHLGGWIFPGIETMHQSLLTNTTNIMLNNKIKPHINLATNTHDNVINGCFAATVGAIEMAINQAQQMNINIDQLIFTGGNTNMIVDYFEMKGVVIDNLVFQGLLRYLS